MNLLAGKVSFASYIGNTIRYDIELDPETLFKVDVQNPWNQKTFPIAEKVYVCFPVQITLEIPLLPRGEDLNVKMETTVARSKPSVWSEMKVGGLLAYAAVWAFSSSSSSIL